MAKIAGTFVPVSPDVPVVDSKYIKGGLQVAADEAARLALPLTMLSVGTHVFQDDTNATWRVLSIEGQTVSWEEVSSAAATWSTLQGKPLVVAAGADAAEARAAIGAASAAEVGDIAAALTVINGE